MTHERRAGFALLVLFILSGFAGLIYQSIWSHYLGLVLGHAAYAQTLVLGLFMGGMALGAWLAGKWTLRIRHLILGYAIVEGIIGLFGLLFHPLFVGYIEFSQGVALPSLSSATLASGYQWISSGLLILPQCILLGATFPLLSAGYLRLAPREDGRVLGGLYFSNSIGAAFGALFSTFVLLPAIGMPGAMVAAGVLNLLVALGSLVVWRMSAPPAAIAPQAASTTSADAGDGTQNPLLQTMVVATFLSGAFSFVYEIGWIRLLNQALGATVHSFELMLAAFILGLAFGGLWIRQRATRIVDAVRYAGYAQVWMGICAMLSVVIFANSFEWVGWMMRTFQRTDDGYVLYSLGTATISLLVMFPAAFFAGMTLPLFTMALLRSGGGEQSIGRIYSANTLGAIAGVALTVHLLIPILGVRFAVIAAAIGDAAIGLYLLRSVAQNVRPGLAWTAAGAACLALVISFAGSWTSPLTQAAGVFRDGVVRLPEGTHIPFFTDGKTATVAVYATADGSYGTISTNGKPDATLAVHLDTPPPADEITMLMAAALPLALHPNPKDVGIIGWGSGLTTHTMLGSPAPHRVESIEIERMMWQGAKQFGARVSRGYDDPRSKIVFEDARTWFSTGARRYDVIVSEPSNPWVSGIASLFTTEFYTFLKAHLNEGGVLVQWIQSYELGDPLLSRMVRALIDTFPEVELYATNEGDLLLVSSVAPLGDVDISRLQHEPLRTELARVGLENPGDFAVRRIGDAKLARVFTELMGGESHSDYYPTVALQAPRDRFKSNASTVLYAVRWGGFPLVDILGGEPAVARDAPVHNMPFVDSIRGRALRVTDSLKTGRVVPDLELNAAASVALLLQMSNAPVSERDALSWGRSLALSATYSLSHLPAKDLEGVWIAPTWLAAGQPAFVLDTMAAYEATARRDPEAMSSLARHALDAHAEVLPGEVREQLLVMALIGAASRGDMKDARALEDTYGSQPGMAANLGQIRAFLLAWADSGR